MSVRGIKKLFPDGRTKVLTMSYDDGVTQDKKLIEIFDEYGIKGTFNINTGFIAQKDSLVRKGREVTHYHIEMDDIKKIYRNHEVAVHTVTHPFLEKLSEQMVAYEVLVDKKNIEEIVGYPVRGMAYPFGTYSKEVMDTIKSCGIEYSRTVKSTWGFELPKNYLEWHPTCHHSDSRILELSRKFLEDKSGELMLFYVWGHSYEFDVDDNWNSIEEFCRIMGNNPDIWYATNIEIVDYLKACDRLIYSTTGSSIYNPSAIDVWIDINNVVYKIGAGEIVHCSDSELPL